MTGNRWRDSDDAPFSKSILRPASDPQPKAKPRSTLKPRQALKRQRIDHTDHGEGPIRSMRTLIREMALTDPGRLPQSISDELEDRGYQAPILTVSTIRADTLGLYPRSRQEVPIIAKPKAGQARPGPNKRIPPARR
jgi:hypothetical protein